MLMAVLIIVSLFSPCSISAEIAGPVEYHFPVDGQEWIESNRVQGAEGLTIIYVPKGETRHSAGEFARVDINQYYLDVEHPLASLYEALKKQFINKDITVKVLEQDSFSVLYEWFASQESTIDTLGWGRSIVSPDGSVFITYQTHDLNHIDLLRRRWLIALQNVTLTR